MIKIQNPIWDASPHAQADYLNPVINSMTRIKHTLHELFNTDCKTTHTGCDRGEITTKLSIKFLFSGCIKFEVWGMELSQWSHTGSM